MIFNGWPPQSNEGAAGSEFVLLRTACQRWRGQEFVKAVRRFSLTNQTERIMLVLSRKTEEDILIGDSIVVKIIEIRGDKVRLGIEAPKDVSVHRREVSEAIARDGKKKI